MSPFITLIKLTRIGVLLSAVFLFTACTITTGELDPTHEILESPVLRFENNQVFWDDIPNAGSYKLQKGTAIIVGNQTSPFAINSSSDDGIYRIVAYPANYSTHVQSVRQENVGVVNVTYIEPTKLDKPILSFLNNELSWANVTDAATYNLYKNNIAVDLTGVTNNYPILAADQDGDYTLEAVPLETSRLLKMSDKSDVVSVTYVMPVQLVKPILVFAENEITWTDVADADTYQLFKDGVALDVTSVSPYKITSADQNGKYTIVAKSSDAPLVYLDSDVSNEIDVVFVDVVI
jgi:hypothetical protein